MIDEGVEEDKGQVWKRPATSVWWAEKRGDTRKAVFRLNVPPRSTYKKNGRVSVQLHLATRTLNISGVKQNLMEYSIQWVAAFGPVESVSEQTSVAASASIEDFLCRSAGSKGATMKV